MATTARSKKPKTVKLNAFNKATGERIDFAVEDTPQGIRQAWVELMDIEQVAALKRKALAELVDQRLGEDKEWDLGNGFRFVRVSRQNKAFDMAVLKKYLTEDQLMDIVVPNNAATKKLLTELVKRGDIDPTASHEIADSMVVTSTTSYPQLMLPDMRS